MIWNGQVPGDRDKETDLSCLDRGDVKKMSAWQKKLCPQVETEKWWNDINWWSDLSPKQPDRGSSSGNPSDAGGQDTSGGPDGPGGLGGGGSGITWWPGSPGHQCTPLGADILPKRNDLRPLGLTGTGQCGIPCNLDWYCDWWPDGLAPFFPDPLDPVSILSSPDSFALCSTLYLTFVEIVTS